MSSPALLSMSLACNIFFGLTHMDSRASSLPERDTKMAGLASASHDNTDHVARTLPFWITSRCTSTQFRRLVTLFFKVSTSFPLQ
ncbi:hypothetical protein JB92DRAFT_2910552 [Gautieria morchelliformis]|nr:hypothetical protein JB92DRAFT_2910552 [Gautieria morchelliformis]